MQEGAGPQVSFLVFVQAQANVIGLYAEHSFGFSVNRAITENTRAPPDEHRPVAFFKKTPDVFVGDDFIFALGVAEGEFLHGWVIVAKPEEESAHPDSPVAVGIYGGNIILQDSAARQFQGGNAGHGERAPVNDP